MLSDDLPRAAAKRYLQIGVFFSTNTFLRLHMGSESAMARQLQLECDTRSTYEETSWKA
jgi:hypothetical protein